MKSSYFLNDNIGWSCGSLGVIYKTTNGGTNWVYQYANTLQELNTIQFFDENTGYISGPGVILKTTTGGTIGINTISSEIPFSYSLKQNYPNPFNPTTKINFAIPKSSGVKITVFY